MKNGKIPRELEYLLDEARPELTEVDTHVRLPPYIEKGQDKHPCPYNDDCLVKHIKETCTDFRNCQTHKFYLRYGKDYNQMFI